MRLGNFLLSVFMITRLWAAQGEGLVGRTSTLQLLAFCLWPHRSSAMLLNQTEFAGASARHKAITGANSGSWLYLLSFLFWNSKPRFSKIVVSPKLQTTKVKSYRQFVPCLLPLVKHEAHRKGIKRKSPQCFRIDIHVKIPFLSAKICHVWFFTTFLFCRKR